MIGMFVFGGVCFLNAALALAAGMVGVSMVLSAIGGYIIVTASYLYRAKKRLEENRERLEALIELVSNIGALGITNTKWHFDEKDKLHPWEIDPDAVKFIAVDEAEEEGDNDE